MRDPLNPFLAPDTAGPGISIVIAIFMLAGIGFMIHDRDAHLPGSISHAQVDRNLNHHFAFSCSGLGRRDFWMDTTGAGAIDRPG